MWNYRCGLNRRIACRNCSNFGILFFFLRVPSRTSRLIVQNNEAVGPLRWSVDGATPTGDVVCRLFSTTVTAVVRGQSPAQHVSPKSANTSP